MATGGAWLVLNPGAGRKAGLPTNMVTPEQARQALARCCALAAVRLTEHKGHATEIAREAVAAGADLVVAGGGDGTVHEVARALVGTPVTLGVLPLGSMMNIARALGIPRELEAAAEVIRERRTVHMDVGLASTGRAQSYFFETAGVGFDAGIFAYGNQIDAGNWRALLPLLRFMLRYRQRPAYLTVDGRRALVRAFMITVAICPFTGAGMAVAPQAKIDDGQFDVLVRECRGRVELLRLAFAMKLAQQVCSPLTRTLRGAVVEVEHVRKRLMVHSDGRILGRTPARFELLPAALKVIVGPPQPGQPTAITTLPTRFDAAARPQ